MGTGGGPHPGGVVVLYENVKLAVTGGVITVTVMKPEGAVTVKIKQATGQVES
jgi:hypothetical protein